MTDVEGPGLTAALRAERPDIMDAADFCALGAAPTDPAIACAAAAAAEDDFGRGEGVAVGA